MEQVETRSRRAAARGAGVAGGADGRRVPQAVAQFIGGPCLDYQRLIVSPVAICQALGWMAAPELRAKIETFERVCN